ncbi:hypothetical protein BGZ47_008889 [Haplosporangium gracile]|nr:hypothetical protein BGZ47_008889 [Haplosporangium gracile]
MGLKFFKLGTKKTPATPTSSSITTTTNNKATSRNSPRALQVPAILKRIFDHLQDDPETLHQSVILVCRQWYYLNQSRIRRELVWVDDAKNNSSKSFDKLVTRLPQASKLQWHSNDPQLKNKYTLKLLQTLEGNRDRYQQSRNLAAAPTASSKKSKTPLKNDGLLRHFKLTYSGLLFLKALPFLQSLTSLRLVVVGSDTIRLATVLAACPNLLSLQLESITGVIQLPSSWISPSPSNALLPLKSFILENVIFSQLELENLLKSTPHLKVLQLRNLRETTNASAFVYSWHGLVAQLRVLQISLRSIHFSIYGKPMEDEREKVLVIAPRSDEWAFRSFDLTPTVSYYLREIPNFVTTLELIAPGRSDPGHGLELHQFLCSSPHLLHLKATQSVCLIERMDVHRRWSPSSRAGINVDRTAGIWACRNLKTLHIRVHNLGSPAIQDSPVRSRILYGYISRVLPKLQDLYLFELENEPGLSLDLFGGMCFLARLQHLDSFRLGTGKNDQNVRPGDISWMLASGRTALSKSERGECVLTWQQLLMSDSAQEAKRVASLNGRDYVAELYGSSSVKIHIEPQLIASLSQLGLLLDVKALADQMNSKQGYVCWPKLKFLTVYQPLTSTFILAKGYTRVGKVAASDLDSRINDDLGAMMR